MREKKPLHVSYLLPKGSNLHVWKGQATTKLSAYRQFKQSEQRSRYPREVLKMKDYDFEQYGTVVKLVRGRWKPVYQ